MTMLHALSFDVEEYFHVHAYSGVIDPANWDEYPSRIEVGTKIILDLLADAQVRATFFVLGWVAQRQPALVRSIIAAGHELASHGFHHRRVDQQLADEFREDVRIAKHLLEDVAGAPVTAYRAPSFSINAHTPWAHQILVEEGHTLDSSLRGPETAPFLIETPAGPIQEFPVPYFSLAGRRIGVGGGGFFRLFPEWFTRRAIRSAGQPFCVYLHPWEFDPDQPRIACSATATFRQRVGLHKTASRLGRLLQSFQFDSLTNSLKAYRSGHMGRTACNMQTMSVAGAPG